MSSHPWPYDPKLPRWQPPRGQADEVRWRSAVPSREPEITAKDIMSAGETAELLGCSTRHIYDLVGRDELPGARYLGRTIIVVRPVLVDWLLNGGSRTGRDHE